MQDEDRDRRLEEALARAFAHFELEEFEATAAELEQLLAEEGRGHATAAEGHARALFAMAESELRAARNPDEEPPPVDVGEILAQDAQAEYQLAAGALLAQHGRREAAEAVLGALLAHDIGDDAKYALFFLSLARMQAYDYDAAEQALERLTAEAPDWPQGHLQRARCARDRGDLPAAVVHQERYLALVPADGDEWMALGILHSEDKAWRQAEAAFARAETLDPRSPTLAFNRGITARRAGNQQRLRECEAVLAEDLGDDWRTLVLRGYIAEIDGHLWPAWEAFEEATDPELEREESDANDEECAMTHALAFTVEHGMNDQVELLFGRCVESWLFCFEVLEQLRRHEGRHALRAKDWAIVVSTEVVDEDALAHLREEGEEPSAFRCFRNYRVLSDGAEDAEARAIAFERRLGAHDVRAEETEEMEDVADVLLGVWWIDSDATCMKVAPE